MSAKIQDGLNAKSRYAKKNIKQYKFDCIISTEQDIIQKMETQSNKAGYIKKLIREDISKEKK